MLTIRPPQAADRDAWDLLYQGYARFYQVEQTAAMRARLGLAVGCRPREPVPDGL